MTDTQEQIEKNFDLLPEEIQDKLFAPEVELKVQKIGIDTGLLVNNLKKLNTLVNLVILGLIPEKEFGIECQKTFNLEQKSVGNLEEAISREIFEPIKATKIKALVERARYEAEERELFEEVAVTPVSTAPANIPTEVKEEPLIPPLTPKVMQPKPAAPEVILMHPFEEKLQGAPAAAAVSTPSAMPATFTPEPTPVVPTPSAPVVPTAPQGAIAFTPAQNGSPRGTLTHDPYREPLE